MTNVIARGHFSQVILIAGWVIWSNQTKAMNVILKAGYVSAVLASLSVLGYGLVQVLQVLDVLAYPWDEYLIYGFSLGISIPFLVMVVAFHFTLMLPGRMWSATALAFAAVYLVFAFIVYGVQLTVVLPGSKEDHTLDVLRMTPHSFFWTLDALAYLSMGLATTFIIPATKAIAKTGWLRSMLYGHTLMTMIALIVYFYPHYSTGLLLVASPWLITACGSCVLMAIYFKKVKRFI